MTPDNSENDFDLVDFADESVARGITHENETQISEEELRALIQEWRNRADGINNDSEYWMGVKNAYGELADELEALLEGDSS